MSRRMGSGDARARRRLTMILAALLFVVLAPSAAADPPGLTWAVSIDDRDLESVTRSNPLELGTSDSARVRLFLDNAGTEPLLVRSIRIEGKVIGMAFFSYTTRLDIVLPPGEQTERRFDVDISDLRGQATGLLPTSVIMISPEREPVARRAFAVDVQGTVASVYGAFGLIMAGITAVVLASLLLSIWRRQLPANRWQRAVRFLPAGLGIGLVVTFTLSATSLLVPSAVWWLPLLLLCGGGAFLIGYLLPVGSDDAPSAPDADALDPADRLVR
ncbi:MAG TPA: hypothetical protein VIT41_03180 [Microlunatus sp.]